VPLAALLAHQRAAVLVHVDPELLGDALSAARQTQRSSRETVGLPAGVALRQLLGVGRCSPSIVFGGPERPALASMSVL
jgi:hypothetical protein